MSIDAQRLQAFLDEGLREGLYSGAAAAISAPDGRVAAYAGTHASDDVRPVGPDSLFDLASVSKPFTATVLARLIEDGRIDPDEPVADVLQVGSGPGADAITARMLLRHTSGLPAESALWRQSGLPPEQRLDRLLATPLESAPDELFRYSCLGYIAAGALAEQVTGRPLPALLDELVLRPLDLRSVGYGPVDRSAAVATEDESYAGRGMVRGAVHDELNWYLGGEVGNAGLFANAEDVLRFAESFRDATLLGPEAIARMTTDALEPHQNPGFGHGLGLRIADPEFMGSLRAFGHLGFTGTVWLAVPGSGVVGVLLTNRVHPSRERVDINLLPLRFATLLESV